MREFYGSGNYFNALNDNTKERIGVVDQRFWQHEWHHGDSGSIIGFINKSDDKETIMAEYAERIRKHAEFQKSFEAYGKECRKQQRALYNTLIANFGKEKLAQACGGNVTVIAELEKTYNVWRSLDRKLIAIRTIDETGKVLVDVHINRNGGLKRNP